MQEVVIVGNSAEVGNIDGANVADFLHRVAQLAPPAFLLQQQQQLLQLRQRQQQQLQQQQQQQQQQKLHQHQHQSQQNRGIKQRLQTPSQSQTQTQTHSSNAVFHISHVVNLVASTQRSFDAKATVNVLWSFARLRH